MQDDVLGRGGERSESSEVTAEARRSRLEEETAETADEVEDSLEAGRDKIPLDFREPRPPGVA